MSFLVVRWWVILSVLVIGALVAAAASALLSSRRPGWARGKRVVAAALVAPVLILLGTAVGIGMTLSSGPADQWDDLATAVLLQIGLIGAGLTFVAGLAGALTVDRALRS